MHITSLVSLQKMPKQAAAEEFSSRATRIKGEFSFISSNVSQPNIEEVYQIGLIQSPDGSNSGDF